MPGGARHAVPAPRRDARAFGGVCEPSHAYHTPSGTVYSRILHSFFFILNSQIPISPLDFRHPSLRYSFIPARRGAPTGGACWRSGERRLRVRSTQPDLRGPRETPPGPTTWVRPATGWWKRMKAGESPLNQGRTVWAPLSVSRRRSRGLRKTPQWGAERRAGPRHGSAILSADGMGLAARQTNGRGVPRLRISALRYPLMGMRRVRNRQFGTTARRDAPRGNAPTRLGTCTEE
jgi:hypothetical protein